MEQKQNNNMSDEQNAKKIVDSIFSSGFNTNRTFYEMAYNAAMEMAEWKERKMIEKACEWIEENIGKHIHINTDWNIPEIDYDFFIIFKKAMEE